MLNLWGKRVQLPQLTVVPQVYHNLPWVRKVFLKVTLQQYGVVMYTVDSLEIFNDLWLTLAKLLPIDLTVQAFYTSNFSRVWRVSYTQFHFIYSVAINMLLL